MKVKSGDVTAGGLVDADGIVWSSAVQIFARSRNEAVDVIGHLLRKAPASWRYDIRKQGKGGIAPSGVPWLLEVSNIRAGKDRWPAWPEGWTVAGE